MRNMLSTLLLSQGTPMLLAGDEFGRTQGGNNNAYCQDNEVSWVNWKLEEKGKSLLHFVQRLTRLRHKYPILRRNRFLTGEYVEDLGVKDVTWIYPSGTEITQEQWTDDLKCFGMLLDGRAQTTGIRQQGHEATLLIVINVHHEQLDFTLPESPGSNEWSMMLNTDDPRCEDHCRTLTAGSVYQVPPRSLQTFVLGAVDNPQLQ
jgi:glycogen operon protein